MPLPMVSRFAQYKRFDEVTKLIQVGFYKVGDICDLPIYCQDVWGEIGNDWNSQVCNPNGLQLNDNGNGTWSFISFP